MFNKHQKAFIKLFNEVARSFNRYRVFEDFISMSGIAIQNAFLKSDGLEQKYLKIAGGYQNDDLSKLSDLLAEVVLGLEMKPCDFLGEIFMELGLENKDMGQFFTPYDISKAISILNWDKETELLLQRESFITIADPACGTAGTIIAFYELMLERGFNPQKQLWASCIDIDPLAAMMAYIQMSLLGIPGEVLIGNSLTLKINQVMHTPMHFIGDWDLKLDIYRRRKEQVA